jgi:hypothetical protein
MPPQLLVGGKRAVDFNGNIRKSENKVDEKLKYFSQVMDLKEEDKTLFNRTFSTVAGFCPR